MYFRIAAVYKPYIKALLLSGLIPLKHIVLNANAVGCRNKYSAAAKVFKAVIMY